MKNLFSWSLVPIHWAQLCCQVPVVRILFRLLHKTWVHFWSLLPTSHKDILKAGNVFTCKINNQELSFWGTGAKLCSLRLVSRSPIYSNIFISNNWGWHWHVITVTQLSFGTWGHPKYCSFISGVLMIQIKLLAFTGKVNCVK